ncbi:MAG: glycosyltransferase family 4 protein [Candidatus Promineofilum sp.]|nr:glycosyltransferase family 4 protein [Promineifilum sp.]
MKVLYIWFYSRSFPDYPKVAAVLREQGHEALVANYDDAGDIVWYRGDVLAARVRGPRRAPHRVARLPVVRTVWPWLAFVGFMLRLRSFFRHENADVVHVCPNAARLVWLLPLNMPRAMRFVIDYRQIAQREGRGPIGRLKSGWANSLRVLYCRFFYDRATFLHALGAAKVLGPEWARWADVVPLAVDDPFLEYVNERPRRGEPVAFLYLGSIARIRKLEQILEAAQLAAAETDGFCIDFIGPDVSDGYYHGLIKEKGLSRFVRILPPIPYDRVPETVTTYDVALTIVPESPPDWQYQPTIKGIEYRALGMPVIATDFAPNRELVVNERNGLLVSNTAADIAAAMLRFICDPAFSARVKANAQTMREGPTWEMIASRYVSIYRSLQ